MSTTPDTVSVQHTASTVVYPETKGIPDNIAIVVKGLGKMYRIYDRPQDRLKHMLWRGRRKFGNEFWALRDLSFEISKGETVGIVGRNGSGKSTLLQMIAGTLTPTTGSVYVKGRIAALLELGSGFNPEFTGRENVFLNGSILGISREEMEQRFDDIAAFADIGSFMEQPVKTFSSGMFARLAFAVAVSVDPDILIVDEILAVGDIGFQQKCVNRLRIMRDNGVTLLFVSHSPDAIKSICSKGLFLIDGKSIFWGNATQAIDLYFNYIREQANDAFIDTQEHFETPVPIQSVVEGTSRYGTGHVQIINVQLFDESGNPSIVFRFGDVISLRVRVKSYILTSNLSISFLIRDFSGIDLLGTTTFDEYISLGNIDVNTEKVVLFKFVNQLHIGNYGISVAAHSVSHKDYSDNLLFDQIDGCAYFTVTPDLDRPVHYKFYTPIEVILEESAT